MRKFKTVLLRHYIDGTIHFDWLLENPSAVGGRNARLWTARLLIPSWLWPRRKTWDLEPLPPHRHLYLTYQGPISNNRGAVTRIDHGHFRVLCWTSDLIDIELSLEHCDGRVELRPLSPTLIRAFWIDR